MLRSKRLHLIFIILSAALSLTFGNARADDAEEMRAKQRFTSYKSQAQRLQAAPQARYLVQELSFLNQWIGQAERELAEDEEERFMRVVDLIQVQLQLIDVSIEELIARERITVVEQEAIDLEARAKREREAIVELERKLGGVLSAPAQPAQMAPQPAPQPAYPAQVAPQPAPQPVYPTPAPSAP